MKHLKAYASLKEYIPIKQGLRHRLCRLLSLLTTLLKEYIPIKQGLRRSRSTPLFCNKLSQRVYSNKTRINASHGKQFSISGNNHSLDS